MQADTPLRGRDTPAEDSDLLSCVGDGVEYRPLSPNTGLKGVLN